MNSGAPTASTVSCHTNSNVLYRYTPAPILLSTIERSGRSLRVEKLMRASWLIFRKYSVNILRDSWFTIHESNSVSRVFYIYSVCCNNVILIRVLYFDVVCAVDTSCFNSFWLLFFGSIFLFSWTSKKLGTSDETIRDLCSFLTLINKQGYFLLIVYHIPSFCVNSGDLRYIVWNFVLTKGMGET